MSVNHKNHYENLEEAQFRLTGTVVIYDKNPAYIHSVHNHDDGIFRVRISLLPGRLNEDDRPIDDEDAQEPGKVYRKMINSPKFDRFRPFKLGFLNLFTNGPHARYTTRLPVRRSKQGLDATAFNSTFIGSGAVPALGRGGGEFLTIAQSEAFAEMVKGVYPSIEETLDTLSLGSSIGVDNDYAVHRDELGLDFLYFKEDKVGLVRAGEVLLGRSFNYLREQVISLPNLPNNVSTL